MYCIYITTSPFEPSLPLTAYFRRHSPSLSDICALAFKVKVITGNQTNLEAGNTRTENGRF